jgi:hypothetical protein
MKFLNDCLDADTTPQQFLDELNGRVFFWMTEERLRRLMGGRFYRNNPQLVLQFDTGEVLERYGEVAELAPYNTGSMHVPNAPTRGRSVFSRIDDYPYDAWRRRRGASEDAVVEFTIPEAVPDAADLTFQVERWVGGGPHSIVYKR